MDALNALNTLNTLNLEYDAALNALTECSAHSEFGTW